MTKKPETVKEEDLIQRKDGLYYKKDAKVPFTGVSKQFHRINMYRDEPFKFSRKKGEFLTYKNYKNGNTHGSAETFFSNGQLKQKGNYINGVLHGPYEKFF